MWSGNGFLKYLALPPNFLTSKDLCLSSIPLTRAERTSPVQLTPLFETLRRDPS